MSFQKKTNISVWELLKLSDKQEILVKSLLVSHCQVSDLADLCTGNLNFGIPKNVSLTLISFQSLFAINQAMINQSFKNNWAFPPCLSVLKSFNSSRWFFKNPLLHCLNAENDISLINQVSSFPSSKGAQVSYKRSNLHNNKVNLTCLLTRCLFNKERVSYKFHRSHIPI